MSMWWVHPVYTSYLITSLGSGIVQLWDVSNLNLFHPMPVTAAATKSRVAWSKLIWPAEALAQFLSFSSALRSSSFPFSIPSRVCLSFPPSPLTLSFSLSRRSRWKCILSWGLQVVSTGFRRSQARCAFSVKRGLPRCSSGGVRGRRWACIPYSRRPSTLVSRPLSHTQLYVSFSPTTTVRTVDIYNIFDVVFFLRSSLASRPESPTEFLLVSLQSLSTFARLQPYSSSYVCVE